MKNYCRKIENYFVKVRLCRYKVGSEVKNAKEAIAAVSKYVKDLDRENFIVLHLNARNVVVAIDQSSIGSENAALISPSCVFRISLLCNATSVILMHNHPAASPVLSNAVASNEDCKVTKRLIDAGRLLGVEVLDHIIVTGNDHYSFSENNKMGQEEKC